MKRKHLRAFIFIFLLFSIWNSAIAASKVRLYDNTQPYTGRVGIVKPDIPLKIEKIDGMALDEIRFKFDSGFISGDEAYYLLPGVHVIQACGGQSDPYRITTVNT